jgi:hypothetical protein
MKHHSQIFATAIIACALPSTLFAQRPAGGTGQARTNVNQNANTTRNVKVNDNRNVNVNGNKNVNVNVNRNVYVNANGHGGYYGGYYGGGCCYNPVAVAAAVTATAIVVGSMVRTLPPACSLIMINGFTYQQCGSVWYQPQFSGTTTTYVVVNAPR